MSSLNAEAESLDMPMEKKAESAYNAYAASTGNKNFRGDDMPKWADLPEPIRIAWEAAARHVLNLDNWQHSLTPERITELEQSWKGWKPE